MVLRSCSQVDNATVKTAANQINTHDDHVISPLGVRQVLQITGHVALTVSPFFWRAVVEGVVFIGGSTAFTETTL